jgi:chitin synthase
VKFFGPQVEQLFTDFTGNDATDAWHYIVRSDPKSSIYLQCMKNMFYIGTIDHRQDLKCQFGNYLLLSISFMLVSVIGFKFLAALQCSGVREPESHSKFVICQVPCYTEGTPFLNLQALNH